MGCGELLGLSGQAALFCASLSWWPPAHSGLLLAGSFIWEAGPWNTAALFRFRPSGLPGGFELLWPESHQTALTAEPGVPQDAFPHKRRPSQPSCVCPSLVQTYKQQGNTVLKLGDAVIPYHESFKMYITTNLPNPHYSPEISTKLTLINFTLSPRYI